MNTSQLIEATSNIQYPSFAGKTVAQIATERRDYNESIAHLEAGWKFWLAEEYAWDLNQKARDAIYAKAWSDGHSSGYSEVEHHYLELSELVRNAL